MDPLIELSLALNSLKFTRLPYTLGNVPVSELMLTISVESFPKLAIPCGNVLDRLFLWRFSDVRFRNNDTSSGIVPTRLKEVSTMLFTVEVVCGLLVIAQLIPRHNEMHGSEFGYGNLQWYQDEEYSNTWYEIVYKELPVTGCSEDEQFHSWNTEPMLVALTNEHIPTPSFIGKLCIWFVYCTLASTISPVDKKYYSNEIQCHVIILIYIL